MDDGGIDAVALGAAIVALLAMVVAIWQAREARGSRKAAEQQVSEAARSAAAAEEQVLLLREQVASESRARSRPRFELNFPEFRGQDVVAVTIHMTGGDPINALGVAVSGPHVQGLSRSPNGGRAEPGSLLIVPALHPGAQERVYVHLEKHQVRTFVDLRLQCDYKDKEAIEVQYHRELLHDAMS